jgi:tRNA(adenine34) deaminase
VKTLYRLLEDERLNHRVAVEQSPLASECGALLTKFFSELRKS